MFSTLRKCPMLPLKLVTRAANQLHYLSSNFARARLFIGLNEIFSIDPTMLPAGYESFFAGPIPTEEEKRTEAIKSIDAITMKMQELYGYALREYSRLKHGLLT